MNGRTEGRFGLCSGIHESPLITRSAAFDMRALFTQRANRHFYNKKTTIRKDRSAVDNSNGLMQQIIYMIQKEKHGTLPVSLNWLPKD
jgi:hypothetical protein